MREDMLFCGKFFVNTGDMFQFYSLGKCERKEIEINGETVTRIQIIVKKDKVIQKLKSVIKKDYLEYELKSYITYINSMKDGGENDWYDEKIIDERIALFNEYDTSEKWIKEIIFLMEKGYKTDSNFDVLFFDDFMENKLTEFKGECTPIQKYLLKKDLNIFVDYENESTYYNIPFWNNEEYLFAILNNIDGEDITIDVTNRHNEKVNQMRQRWLFKKNTPVWHRIEIQYNNIVNNLENAVGNEIYLGLYCVYAIALMESYLKQISILCVNSGYIYLNKILENDLNYSARKGKIEYKNLFRELANLKKELIDYFEKESFQSIERIKLYCQKIYEIDDKCQELDFYSRYAQLLEKRNCIVHYGGYESGGNQMQISLSELKKFFELIYKVLEIIDNKVIVTIL